MEFRLIAATGDYIMEVSIDDHPLQVVSTDGQTVVPVTVDKVVMLQGERFDVRVRTDRPGNYWIRVRAFRHGVGLNVTADGKLCRTIYSSWHRMQPNVVCLDFFSVRSEAHVLK